MSRLIIRSGQVHDPIRSQIIFSTAPFFGLVLSVVLLGETLQSVHILAALLFAAGITMLLIEMPTRILIPP